MSDLVIFVELEKRPEKNEIDIKIEKTKLSVKVKNGMKEQISLKKLGISFQKYGSPGYL